MEEYNVFFAGGFDASLCGYTLLLASAAADAAPSAHYNRPGQLLGRSHEALGNPELCSIPTVLLSSFAYPAALKSPEDGLMRLLRAVPSTIGWTETLQRYGTTPKAVMNSTKVTSRVN